MPILYEILSTLFPFSVYSGYCTEYRESLVKAILEISSQKVRCVYLILLADNEDGKRKSLMSLASATYSKTWPWRGGISKFL